MPAAAPIVANPDVIIADEVAGALDLTTCLIDLIRAFGPHHLRCRYA